MDDPSPAYQQLIEENSRLKRRIDELEPPGKDRGKTPDTPKQKRKGLRDTAEKIPGVLYQFYAQPDGSVGFHYVSDAVRDIFGLDNNPSELFQCFTAGIAPECIDVFNESITEAIRDVKPWRYEGRFIKESGESIWFQGISNPVKTREEILFNGFLLDITERKRAEEALKLSEMTYREIFNTVNDTIWIHDIETGEFLDVNNKVTEMFGYPVGEALKLKVEDISSGAPPFTQKTAMELFKKAASGQPQLFEWHCRHRDGHLFWTEVNLKRGTIAGKECVLAIERDIGERKQAQESIRLSEEKFSKIFMTTPDCIAITRIQDGQLLEVNPGFEVITGWKRGEVIGRTSYDIGFWADHSEREKMVEALRAGGEVLYREFHFRRRDGALRNGIYSARSMVIDGEPCLVFLLQDITARRNLEEDHRKLELQLFQSQKLDAVGKLAGGIAHDFNNILMGIQGHISLMLFGMQQAHPFHERLKQMEEHIKRGATLTRQLLGFAREGKYEVLTVDIKELVHKSVELFGHTRKELEISVLCGDGIFPVEADPGQIDQVLLNLYINASQAMPEGGQMYIEISNAILQKEDVLPYDAKPGHYVKISVTDTGTGMDTETLSKIFEPFFTTKSQQGGAGLGLASAYGIIRNHGGIINAYSEPGHGSTFNLYLPASMKTVQKEMEVRGSEILRGEGTVLVVDDEKNILEATADLLRLLGYRVLTASNGQEALSLYDVKTDEIDLVILDMILPGMSGAETMKMLKLINPAVKVILASGYSIQGEARKVMKMGCFGFVQKPFNLTELSQLVHQAIEKKMSS